jgi:hypothetical protein
MSGWIVFAMRVSFASVMMWAFYEIATQPLRFIMLGLSAIFFANAVTQLLKMYDFLKKVDTLDLNID